MIGRRPQPMCKIRPTSKACPKRRARSAISKTPRCSPILGDMVTTDHISPAGSFKETTPAGQYLTDHGVPPREFNSYGARRGNHEVMMRGTFANIRIKNEMLDDVEGGYTLGPDGTQARSLTPPWPIRPMARRWSSSGASNTAQAQAVTGPQKARPSRRQGRDRRKLRAYPPQQSCRHGRDPV